MLKRLGLVSCCALAPCIASAADSGWSSAGNGVANARFAPGETTLSPKTVGGLVSIWSVRTSDDVSDTPTIEGDALYAADNGGMIYRLDKKTGAVVWAEKLSSLSHNQNSFSRTSPAITPGAIIIGDQGEASVYALDKSSGALIWRQKIDQSPGAIITSSPAVVGSVVIVGTSSNQEELAATRKGFVPNFRGSAAALDLATGKLLWQTYTVLDGYTGGAVWGSNPAVDQRRRTVYVGTGDNYSVPAETAQCQTRARNGKQLDACLPADDHIDSILALDLDSGAIKWKRRMTNLDTWTVSCLQSRHAANPCPRPTGSDYDFGSAPNLFSTSGSGPKRDLVGAGQKSGIYWALDRDTGNTVWAAEVNPGGTRGGIQWGSAVEGNRIFVAASNANYVWSAIKGSNKLTDGGFWSALDATTGEILWQTATETKQPPAHAPRTQKPPPGAFARTEGAVTVANGVVYGADGAGYFYALDAATGAKLWQFASGGAAVDGPSIVDGMLFWGDGYADIGPSNPRVVAFGLKK